MIPSRGRVLLRRVESGESYPGGKIIIPETVRDSVMAQHAEVVAVGAFAWCDDYETCPRPPAAHGVFAGDFHTFQRTHTFHWTHPTDLRPGAWVLVAKRAGVECGDDAGKMYLAMAEDILAVLEA